MESPNLGNSCETAVVFSFCSASLCFVQRNANGYEKNHFFSVYSFFAIDLFLLCFVFEFFSLSESFADNLNIDLLSIGI